VAAAAAAVMVVVVAAAAASAQGWIRRGLALQGLKQHGAATAAFKKAHLEGEP
jgi:hypothetical protein